MASASQRDVPIPHSSPATLKLTNIYGDEDLFQSDGNTLSPIKKKTEEEGVITNSKAIVGGTYNIISPPKITKKSAEEGEPEHKPPTGVLRSISTMLLHRKKEEISVAQSRFDLIQSEFDLLKSRFDLIHSKLDLMQATQYLIVVGIAYIIFFK